SANAQVRAAPCVSMRMRPSWCMDHPATKRAQCARRGGAALRDADAALVFPAKTGVRALAVEVVAQLLAIHLARARAQHGRVGRQRALGRARRTYRRHRAEAERGDDAE